MSTTSRPQSFDNHRAKLPPIYLAAGIVLVVETGRRVWFTVREPGLETLWITLVAGAVLAVWFASRRNAQIVQDRVIRLEMQLRLERLLGAARRADVARIALPNLIALRFAGDAELPALVEDVLAGKLARPDDVKRRIQDWQADWLRV